MAYELYYWPGIQGRGEFVRLAFEEAGVNYRDVAREDMGAMTALMEAQDVVRPPFAPPFLKHGKRLIGQTANILLYLGGRIGLAPASEDGRLWTHQIQLTVEDFIGEIHDVHHPLGGNFYYADQKPEARRRAEDFRTSRAPAFLGWFETILTRNTARGGWLVGGRLTYADLSAFQVVAGMRYAFPRAMARLEKDLPRLVALHDCVAARPRMQSYLNSEARPPFNEDGIFRHYPELDDD